jgi:hypothetical protein
MTSPFPETADIHSSTDEYATRFAGPSGQWMLQVQERELRRALEHLTPGKAVDVGGGHAQTEPVLRDLGFDTLVTGSDASCSHRLAEGTPFQVADHLQLPLPDRGVKVAVCFRLLTHCERWPELVAELCRVADQRVVVDYPARVSVNLLAEALFTWKKKFEKNTRTYSLFRHREVREAFAAHGFNVTFRHPQFFWPMVVHRMLNAPKASRFLEAAARVTGLTRLFGSPVVLEARRHTTELEVG